jgi:carbamoyltransferase
METFMHEAPKNGRMFRRGMSSWFTEKLRVPDLIESKLGYEGDIVFASHHESHAASAFYLSPFDNAVVLTVDGVGEWATNSLSQGSGADLSLLREINFPHSIGLMYSAFTHYLGFRVNWGEYKVMGLAPYGEPRYVDTILNELVDVREDGSFRLHLDRFAFLDSEEMTDERFHQVFGRGRREPESVLEPFHMDVARSLQEVTTQILVAQARYGKELTGADHLAMAGGVALNCVANGAIERENLFESLWIQPAANDSGGSLGAALVAWHKVHEKPRESLSVSDGMTGAYLGPEFEEDEIVEALSERGLEGKSLAPEELSEEVADLLANDGVVGWFQGRMEFGPRALGHRSILADPRGLEVQKRVNEKIKFREGFRPFAPAVLAHRRREWFNLGQDSPYMLLVAPVAEQARCPEDESSVEGLERLHMSRSSIQAVTHVDYSARVQTVDVENNPIFYKLIEAFERKTGTPVLLNTSFNLRGEPICATPRDAIASFLASGMDALVLGSHLILRPSGAIPTGKIEERPLPPPEPPELKHRVVASFFMGVIGGIIVWKGVDGLLDGLMLSLASVMLGSALFFPPVFQKIHRGVERMVRLVLNGLSQLLFALIFYGLVTPLGFLKRKTSKSQLDEKPDSALSSYWKDASWSETYDRMY